MKRVFLSRLALCLAMFSGTFLLNGCMVFAPKERDDVLELKVPDKYTMFEEAAPAPDEWWKEFQSEELNQLVDEALEGNLDLVQAEARLRQAQSLARQSRSSLFPDLNMYGDMNLIRQHVDDGKNIDNTSSTDTYGFGLSSRYEADLWGKIRSQIRASDLSLEASQEDVYASKLSLAAEITNRWLEVVTIRSELNLLEEQLKTNKTTLELIELRYRTGNSTALDVYQQRQIVAQTEGFMPTLEGRLETVHHEIAILLGKPPTTGPQLQNSDLPEVPSLPERGLPADLLAKRPDIRGAGLRLREADWRVSVARTDRLPALVLNGSAGYGPSGWNLMLDNWATTLSTGVTMPLFDAGRRKAEVARTREVVNERLAGYQQVVYEAIGEVEDALINEKKQIEYIEALEAQLENAKATQREAVERYRKGLNDYLPVLSAMVSSQSLERSLITANQNRIAYRVQLHRALGGDWAREIDPEEAMAKEKEKKNG